MKILFAFFIFCIVLFIYLHVQFHLKTSNDLEVYEIDDPSKDKLEEICDIRQPVIFDFEESQKIIETTNKDFLLNHYHAFEMKVRNINDADYNSEIYMPLALHSVSKLLNEDKTSSYFSENNSDFLQETGVVKNLQYNDQFLRPPMLSNYNYDIMMASENTATPFRYEINYRNFFLVTQGSVHIKLAPPSSSKYLYPVYDYTNFEFRTPVNPWKVQAKYMADFDKMKCLDVFIEKGKVIHIPAYWWYSIKFSKDTSVSCFHYRTYMNNLAISPYIIMHGLQNQNTKVETIKKVDINKLAHTTESTVAEKETTTENSCETPSENKIDL
jgi:Cupin-like domain